MTSVKAFVNHLQQAAEAQIHVFGASVCMSLWILLKELLSLLEAHLGDSFRRSLIRIGICKFFAYFLFLLDLKYLDMGDEGLVALYLLLHPFISLQG